MKVKTRLNTKKEIKSGFKRAIKFNKVEFLLEFFL